MLSEQLPFPIDDSYPDLIRPIRQEPPVPTPKTHCPRCLGRTHMDGGIASCITCGFEDYGTAHKPDVMGLTVGSSLATLHGPKTRDRQRKSQQLYDATRRGA